MSTQWSPHVARAMHELSNAAPEAPSAIDLDQHQPTPRQGSSRWVTAAAAILVVVAIVGLVAIVRRDDSQPSVGPAGVIDVHHTRVEVSIEAQLSCDRPIDTTGTFPTAVVDTYSDRTGRQWRTRSPFPTAAPTIRSRRGARSIRPVRTNEASIETHGWVASAPTTSRSSSATTGPVGSTP